MSVLAARRWALIVAPVAAGTLTIVGVVADPAPGAEDESSSRRTRSGWSKSEERG
jgi:hypothetical protein